MLNKNRKIMKYCYQKYKIEKIEKKYFRICILCYI